MRWAATSAWARPFSARCRPGAWPGSTWPVVGVAPWRTSNTRVAGGGLRPPLRRGVGRAADRADGGTGSDPRLCRVASDRGQKDSLAAVQREVAACRRCPRLVEWRESVARTGRASYAGQTYWG